MNPSRLVVPFTLLLLLAVGCNSTGKSALEPAPMPATDRMLKVGDLYLGSQPSEAALEQAARDGVKTVVSLRHDGELKDFDEPAVVAGHQMTFIPLGFKKPEELTDEVLDEGRRILREEPRPMLVHCSSGNRVSAIWMAWRVLDEGIAMDDARAEAADLGLKTPEYEEKVRAYIKARQK